MNNFATNLKYLREYTHYTQSNLANNLNISRTSIANYVVIESQQYQV